MRKRPRHVKTERAGLLAVEAACNDLDLIWRDLLQEDVGMDGTIEVAIGEFPTGKLVGAQVKSGQSYIRSETDDGFRFYPNSDDLAYWTSLSIPLFLLLHDPRDGAVYWVDISKHIQDRSEDPLGSAHITFLKTQKLDAGFCSYLHTKFDLSIYNDGQYDSLYQELEAITYEQGAGLARVSISATTLFIEGLWGLCSKLQFHSSLLSDLIRKTVRERDGAVAVSYTFDRATLYPYFTRYFDLLAKHHLALIDATDINHSLYAKLEYPAFIAPLTVNGRKFVAYLRARTVNVHDNQFLSLALIPHAQIEVYASFKEVNGVAKFGPYTDVLYMGFNKYLDYYHLLHLRRGMPGEMAVPVASQTIFYHELCRYIEMQFDEVSKDNIVLRHFDIPLSPLICWLENWYEAAGTIPTQLLRGKSGFELAGFADELTSILAPSGVMTVTEPPLPSLPRTPLASGEELGYSPSNYKN